MVAKKAYSKPELRLGSRRGQVTVQNRGTIFNFQDFFGIRYGAPESPARSLFSVPEWEERID
jgi:hypothetical protein